MNFGTRRQLRTGTVYRAKLPGFVSGTLYASSPTSDTLDLYVEDDAGELEWVARSAGEPTAGMSGNSFTFPVPSGKQFKLDQVGTSGSVIAFFVPCLLDGADPGQPVLETEA